MYRRRRFRPFTIEVEGNIGAGKSSFLEECARMTREILYEGAKVRVAQEPVDRWTDLHGDNLLEMNYEDPQRNAFLFETYVQNTLLKRHLEHSNEPAQILERSLGSERHVFAEYLRDKGILREAEFNVLNEWYELIAGPKAAPAFSDVGTDLIIYLRTSPDVAMERAAKRGRKEEAQVAPEVFKGIHKNYDLWLYGNDRSRIPANVITIDADKDREGIAQQLRTRRADIVDALHEYSLVRTWHVSMPGSRRD